MRTMIITLATIVTVVTTLPSFAQDDYWKSREVCEFAMPSMGPAVGEHASGLIIDILTAVYWKDRIELRHKTLPYKRSLKLLESGKVHCSLDLKGHIQVGTPGKATMAIYDLAVAHLRDTAWEGIQSLKGKRVAYLHGFDIDKLLSIQFKTQMVYDLSSAYHMLERGNVDYVLDDEWLLKDALRESLLPAAPFTFSRIQSFDILPVFADTPEGRRYKNIYDLRMKEMIADGELENIFIKHGLNKDYFNRVRKANGK